MPTVKKKISIIAPMCNEEESIALFVTQTLAVMQSMPFHLEFILIDDGSTDNTIKNCLPLAKENSCIKIIAFSRNYGHEVALTAGIEQCEGDYAILMDSDLQHPPTLIPQLLDKMAQGYDIVCAKRNNRHYENWLRRSASALFYFIASKMTGFKLDGGRTNYRLLNRKVIDSFKQMKENNRHLLMLFAYIGYDTATVTFECTARQKGKSKYNTRRLINLAIDSIIAFSHRPLRYMSLLSVFISLVLTFYAGFILLEGVFYTPHFAKGITSIIFIMSGLFAVLFFFLAIMSEYISHIIIETKARPLYYIRETIQFLKSHD